MKSLLKILVIEDNADCMANMKTVFDSITDTKLEVVYTTNIIDALELLKINSIDSIVINQHLAAITCAKFHSKNSNDGLRPFAFEFTAGQFTRLYIDLESDGDVYGPADILERLNPFVSHVNILGFF